VHCLHRACGRALASIYSSKSYWVYPVRAHACTSIKPLRSGLIEVQACALTGGCHHACEMLSARVKRLRPCSPWLPFQKRFRRSAAVSEAPPHCCWRHCSSGRGTARGPAQLQQFISAVFLIQLCFIQLAASVHMQLSSDPRQKLPYHCLLKNLQSQKPLSPL